MINKEFFKNAEEVANERGITVEDVYETLKKMLINSYKKLTFSLMFHIHLQL